MLIVGLGASAGGLEPLEQFFSQMPDRSGLAFVVVQHLAPDYVSALTELLGRHTKMPVTEATDGTTPQADHVYVIAPGTRLGIFRGSFQVKPSDAARRSPIDGFLSSLSEDQGAQAVGIILSGSGSDGTEGLRAIKERGGLTLAQTPETAKYDQMPKSAIAAGVVDEVLPVEQMPARLLQGPREAAQGRQRPSDSPIAPAPLAAATPSDEQLAASVEQICKILQRVTGHDFSHYKRGTVLRRLRRRIQLRSSCSPSEYTDFLDKDAQEAELLAKDLLIGVTEFFRDPEAFEYLGQHVLPQLLGAASMQEGIRIWVPGCASGEEAYSLAILIREQLTDAPASPPVQIFATDIDAGAIAEARIARYPADIAQHVSPERLARFFTQDGPFYQVAREAREMCIFSEHSLIRDPPFLGLDLISCRNVLIYLDTELQTKLIPVLHYALRRNGYLFLGPAEGLAGHPELFETVHKRFHIFKRAEAVTRGLVEFPVASRTIPRFRPPSLQAPVSTPTQEQAAKTAFERLMLQEYGCPGVLVSGNGDVLCVAGPTGRYLQPPSGFLTNNILDIAHVGLRIELRTALRAAARSGRKVVRDDVSVEVEGAPRPLRLTVRRLPGVPREGLYAVILQDRGAAPPEPAEPAEPGEPGEPPAASTESESAVEQLESELRTTRATLHSTIEELESANEELKSTNEEMLSTNEEMQSANEELQSSQEELKSVNEELATVNSELSRKVDELGRANSDLQNLFSSTDIATLFLDRDQQLTRFTPAAKALFRLIEADVGRPLSDLAPRFINADLAADVSEVLHMLSPVERHVETLDRQACYLLRIRPYRTTGDVIAGAVVTLAEITKLKRADELLRADLEATNRFLKIGSLFLQEGNLTSILDEIIDAAIAISGADFGTFQILDPVSGHLKLAASRGLPPWWLEYWNSVTPGHGTCGKAFELRERIVVEDVETSPIFIGTPALEIQRKAGVRAVQSTPLMSRAGEPLGMFSTHYKAPGRPGERALHLLDLIARQASDILEKAQAQQALRESEERFRAFVEASSEALFRLSPDWKEMRQLLGHGFLANPEGSSGGSRSWLEQYIPLDEQPRVRGSIEEAIRQKSVFELEHRVLRADGTVGWAASRAVPLKDASGEIAEWFGAAKDITPWKRVERLEAANERLVEADQRKNEFLGILSHELRNPLAPIRYAANLLARSGPSGEQAQRALAIINRQVGHMAHLVDDLLDVSRITHGKVPLTREPLELNELVQRTVEDHRGVFSEGGIDLAVQAAPAELWVYGDRTRLAQAVGNLLQNAAKFTPRGGKTKVSVEGDSSAGQTYIYVHDTGCGIPAELLSRLFQPFIQAEMPLDRSKGGLGLGLALVKGLVELHGGSVRAASEGLGRGAIFTIVLPLAPAGSAAPTQDAKTGACRILVIEDNVDSANSLGDLLACSGYEVEVAYGGLDGIEKTRAFGPDIVLCDIGLPEIDGYQVARTLRADPKLGRIRLIAVTGYTGKTDVSRAKEAGFDGHLAKPPSIEAIERILAEIGRGPRAAKQP